MSRYFNETTKADKWSTKELLANLDIKELVAPGQEGEDAVQDLRSPGVEATPKLILRFPSDVPLLTRRDANSSQAAEAYRILRTRLLRLQAAERVRSVVFSSSLPGEGKSLTTLNLALCCSQISKLSVLVVDADFRTRGLTQVLGCSQAMGLSDVLSGKIVYDQAVLTTDYPGLAVVPAGPATDSPAELFATPQWKEFIDWASENYNLVLVDSPPVLPLTDFELITAPCDRVVFVIRAGSTSREMIRRAAMQLDARKLLGSVFNMSQDGTKINYGNYTGSPLPPTEGL
jgi:capsular exopolysaccharide synthesis family protein